MRTREGGRIQEGKEGSRQEKRAAGKEVRGDGVDGSIGV